MKLVERSLRTLPRETKSNGQKDKLDRFYTPITVVEQCLKLLDLSQYDCIIEPSAGTGNFCKYLPNVKAYDIAPEAENIEQADWLTLDKNIFNSYSNILVCGNPPFGEQSKLAIAFFNEAAKFANTIAFILPLSFKKDSVQNRLSLDFSLTDEIILQDCAFLLKNAQTIQVPCVFQVWKRTNKPREKVKLKTTSDIFSFVSKEEADFRIQRVGGNAGKASFDLTKSPSSNYFIKNHSSLTNEEFIDFVNNLIFPTIEYTVGPKSLSKGELIAIIEENI